MTEIIAQRLAVFLPCNEFRDRDTRFATNTLAGQPKNSALDRSNGRSTRRSSISSYRWNRKPRSSSSIGGMFFRHPIASSNEYFALMPDLYRMTLESAVSWVSNGSFSWDRLFVCQSASPTWRNLSMVESITSRLFGPTTCVNRICPHATASSFYVVIPTVVSVQTNVLA
jgi:hypothetical protein